MMNFTNNPYLSGLPASGLPASGLPAQQRLMQLEAQYPQFAHQQIAMQPVINASFVTNLQEAQAQPVGINTTNVAIDNNNNKIYIKRMDNNGLSATKTYIPQEDTASPVNDINTPVDVKIPKNDLTDLKSEVRALNDTLNKSLVNLSVDIENVINNALENQTKKLRGDKNVTK